MASAATWVGAPGTPLPFEDGTNWSGGAVPNNEDAFIDNGGIATMSTFAGTLFDLKLGALANTSGTIQQTGGNFTTEFSLTVGDKGAGTYDLSGATSSITIRSHLVIGNEGRASQLPEGAPKGVGTFNMSDGAVTLDSTGGGQHILLGHISGGTINMSGGVLTADRFNIGQHGWNLGGEPGWSTDPTLHSRGIMNQLGGTVNVDTALVIAEASGNDNQYNISAGTLRLRNPTSNNVSAIAGSSLGRGTFNISGFANVEIDSHIFAGSGQAPNINTNNSATGAVNISGGTVELGKNIRFAPQAGVTDDPRANLLSGGFMVIGEWGSATASISGGNTTLDFIQLARRNNTTSRGQATQTGGTVTVSRSLAVGGLSPHDNFYEISAGTLNLTGVVIEPDDTPPIPAGFVGDEAAWATAWRNAKNKNELQPGLHVARSSTGAPDTAAFVPSKGRLTISGTAAVTIAGGLYNSTGNLAQTAPGGVGRIEMDGGTLTAASFLNGSAANVGPYDPGVTTPASATYVQSGGTASVGHVTGSGNVTVSGGIMNVGSLRQSAVTVSGGQVNVAADGTSVGTSVVDTLSVTTGKLDLNNNKLITNSPVGSATGNVYNGVSGMVQSGANAGAWNGNGIITSQADALTGLTSIGVGNAGQVLGIAPGATDTFSGQTVTDTSTLVMYTYKGDANLDGFISADDYTAIDFAVAQPGASGWGNGDFNWDGFISADDYTAIDFNLVAQGAPFPTSGAGPNGVSAVPEPASAFGFAALAAGLLARRRSRRR